MTVGVDERTDDVRADEARPSVLPPWTKWIGVAVLVSVAVRGVIALI